MNDVVIPWGLLLVIGIRWLIAAAKDSQDLKQQNTVQNRAAESSRPEKNIIYVSNGYVLCNPHHIHYLTTLGLDPRRGGINERSIKIAARQKLRELNKKTGFKHEKTEDIKAAREFLLDQWNYVISTN